MLLSQRKDRIKESGALQRLCQRAHSTKCTHYRHQRAHTVRVLRINKHKAPDDCRLDWFVSYSFVCVLNLVLDEPLVTFPATSLKLWTLFRNCICCLSIPALTLNQQIGINKAARLLVPRKGQPLGKEFVFDTTCSENSMLG